MGLVERPEGFFERDGAVRDVQEENIYGRDAEVAEHGVDRGGYLVGGVVAGEGIDFAVDGGPARDVGLAEERLGGVGCT